MENNINTQCIMENLKKRYKMKGDSYGQPKCYLGVNVSKYSDSKVKERWGRSLMDEHSRRCNKGELLSQNFHIKRTQWQLSEPFPRMIGILRWALKLGWVDIIIKVSLFSSHNWCAMFSLIIIIHLFKNGHQITK